MTLLRYATATRLLRAVPTEGLFADVIGRLDERGCVIVEGFERFLMRIHHVTRLIVAIFNVVLEPLWNGQVVHFVPALVIRCG